MSVAAQKPKIDNGESDCRLAVEAVGGGARGDWWLGPAVPVDDGCNSMSDGDARTEPGLTVASGGLTEG